MEFTFESWSIRELYDRYESGNIDLNPPYQRNEIWSSRLKRELIDSIEREYPLPAFFVYERSDNDYELVDGQQRSRAIFGYIKKVFTDSQKSFFDEDNETFWDYSLPVIKISQVDDPGIIEDLYTRINKLGMKLNRPELKKAEHFETNFLKLSQELATDEEFENLGLFTPHSVNRMNDLDFITELLALLKFGITEKKKKADELFEVYITEDEYEELKDHFNDILTRLSFFNDEFPIKDTRFRQKNDFYTLFSFLKDTLERDDDYWHLFYSSLLYFENDISPSNEKCYVFQNYAYYCVTQSNSAKARRERLNILNKLFSNTDKEFNDYQENVIGFYKRDPDELKVELDNYLLINANKLES